MKTLNLILLSVGLLIATSSRADEIIVVDVKRNITLSDDDPVYKDFYLNAGENSALRKNMVVSVKRKVAVKESPTKTIGDFDTVVGQLKVIQVGNKVSVAREFKLIPRDESPVLEQIGIMAGDKLDLTGAFFDYNKPKKQKTSETDTKTEEIVQTASASGAVAPVETGAIKTETEKTRSPANTEKNAPSLLQKIIPMPTM